MTPKERILTVLSGSVPDRVPIYTQIPFDVSSKGFVAAPFHGYDDYDSWRSKDPAYSRLVRRMERECDNLYIWRPPCMQSEQIFLSPKNVRGDSVHMGDNRVQTTCAFEQRGLWLTQTKIVRPGTGHTWQVEHYCKSIDDALRLIELPWEGLAPDIGDFLTLEEMLGEKGVMWVTVPSPLLAVARLFDPQNFLILVRTEEASIHRLLSVARDRILSNLQVLLDGGAGPIIRFGGAEHATPPLMSPNDFDKFLVKYDLPLIEICKKKGRFVAYHCHGNIRHVLIRFRELGVDQTDPVETLPDGDVSIEEAREIAGDRMTLTGNIQSREMNHSGPHDIRRRVKGIIHSIGPNRLIITTTGTPLEKITPSLESNYNALIDATLDYGKVSD